MSKITWKDGTTPQIAIIGAGMSGMCTAIQLQKKLGLTSFVLFEMESDLGGTWFTNTYPGCACDVPSHLYSFSFAPNPDWSEKYSSQREILDYLRTVARTFGVYDHVQFHSKVTQAKWDTKKQGYDVEVKDVRTGEERVQFFNIVISAVGALRAPNIPDNLTAFTGQWCHTAKWSPELNLENKVVGIVGSGASGIQVIPKLANVTKELIVFQRTPTWVVPRKSFRYPGIVKRIFKRFPRVHRAYRSFIFLRNELTFNVFKKAPNIFKKIASTLSLKHLHSQITNSTVRSLMTPKYEMGCKRIVVADDYFPAFMKKNVRLVTDPILRVEGHHVITKDHQYKLDALILATGFAVDESMYSAKLIGRQGVSLKESWQDTPQAYLGICSHDFPNTFFLLGPNTGLGHNSVVFMIECQVDYVIDVIKNLMTSNLASMEVLPAVQEGFYRQLTKDMEHTVFSTNCAAWYRNKAGKIFALWAGNCIQYWKRLKFQLDDFDTYPRE